MFKRGKVDPKSILRDNVTPVMQGSKFIMVEREIEVERFGFVCSRRPPI